MSCDQSGGLKGEGQLTLLRAHPLARPASGINSKTLVDRLKPKYMGVQGAGPSQEYVLSTPGHDNDPHNQANRKDAG